MTDKATVDFVRVMAAAEEQEIDLGQIAIQYEDMTEDETADVGLTQTITHALHGDGHLLAKFPEDGSMPKYPHKATAVIYLAG